MGANEKHKCQSPNDARFVLMAEKGKQVPFWWLYCDYKSQLRGEGSQLPDHDCFKEQGQPILAWCDTHKDECVCVGGVFQVPFNLWHESPDFKIAIEETLSAVVRRIKQVTNRVLFGPPWLTALFCVARSLDVEIAGFDGFDATLNSLWRHVHKKWAGPGCPNSDLYAGCVELLRPRLHKEDAKLKEILDARDDQLKAKIKQLGKQQAELVSAQKRALELQGDKSEAARKELARLIDDTGKQQAELERETMAFKEKFAAQLHQAEKQLMHFDKEVTELRAAVKALEKRFGEQEEQMAKLKTLLDGHSTQLNVHTVDIKELHKELAATSATVKKLEAAAETAMALLEEGSTQRKALEDRLEQQTKKLATACVVVKHVNEKVNAANKLATAFKKQQLARRAAHAAAVNAANKIVAARKEQLARRALAAAVLHSPQPRATASSSGTPWWLKEAAAQVFERPAEVFMANKLVAARKEQLARRAHAAAVFMRPPLGDRTNDLLRATDATPCAVEALGEALGEAAGVASPQVDNNAPAAPDAAPARPSPAASPEASLAASPPGASPAAAAEPDDEEAANATPAADGAPALDVAERDAPAAGAMVTMATITTTLVLAICVLLLAVAIKELPLDLDFFLEGV